MNLRVGSHRRPAGDAGALTEFEEHIDADQRASDRVTHRRRGFDVFRTRGIGRRDRQLAQECVEIGAVAEERYILKSFPQVIGKFSEQRFLAEVPRVVGDEVRLRPTLPASFDGG